MRSFILTFVALILISSCGQRWQEKPYEVYWINGTKSLGYSLGDGAFIGRIDYPKYIASNESYLSVYACNENVCAFYYIDKIADHKHADHDEFVYGPFSKLEFFRIKTKLGLPDVRIE